MEKGRLEAFSDGVLAVAITLLVLDLHVDPHSSSPLLDQIREGWPTFAAYVVSFFIIGVIWLNHHNLFRLATGIDRRVMVYNLALLLFVTAIPFTTATYADYVQEGGANARTAVILYGIAMEGMAISFNLILARMLKAGLTTAAVSQQQGRSLLLRYGVGIVMYPVVTLVGVINAPMMLVLYAVIVGYYLGPGLRALDAAETPPLR
jgi:uncharacterized membrane protein